MSEFQFLGRESVYVALENLDPRDILIESLWFHSQQLAV
jgi:hypothetical protein